jgi:uncharacterized protein (TIGR04255 family)
MLPSEYPTLPKSPLVEGLIDIQIIPVGPEKLPELEKLQERLPEYASKMQLAAYSFEAAMAAPGPSSQAAFRQEQSVLGFQLRNEANTRALQFRLNGMNFSILPPYTKFADLEAEARKLWATYSSCIGDSAIARVALRYINRISLPLPFTDFKEYIQTIPEIAPNVPQGLAQFWMRLTIPDTESPSIANVTEWYEGQVEGEAHVLFLDIDAFQMVSYQPGDTRLWDTVSELRRFKNQIFFESITDRLRRTFE